VKKLTSLRNGENGTIKKVLDSAVSARLMDMGCLPGELITMKFRAPLGDPVCVHISGYDLMLRREEADKIEIV